MTSAYERNRKKRPKVKGYSIKELVPENLGEQIIEGRLLEGTFDTIGAGIQKDIDKWSDDDNLNIHEKRLKKLLIGFGDTYSDMRTIDKEELKEAWKDPIDFTNQVGSFLGVRGLEAAGWLSDQTLGRFGRGVGQALRIDPRGREVLGIGAQFYSPKALAKLPGLTKGFLRSRTGQNMLNDLGVNLGYQYRSGKATVDFAKKGFKKVNQKLTEKFSKDPSKRVVKVKAEIIDDVVTKSPKDIAAIVKVAKQNKISLSKAEDWINLSRRGIKPKQRLNPGTNEGTKKQISVNPLDDTSDITYASIDDIRNAELALIAKGVVAPTTEDLYGYLSEYGGTAETFAPVKYQAPPANYKAIEGPDADSKDFNWLSARTGKEYHFDVGGHRIFKVPGMKDPAQAKRYKTWLTNSLIDRYKYQATNPQLSLKRWAAVNRPFIDNKGMEWRLVRADKSAVGANQEFIPMPLNEISSRSMKMKNTSPTQKLVLSRLYNLNVKARNALEKQYPWLREWITEGIGENYHEHMFGLDETEFWNSGFGKSLGYMNNDVYDLITGLGNIVFLTDPRFKVMKDIIADYITPQGKVEIYPGLKRRRDAVKQFKAGPYKGYNAIVGYDANPTSKTFTDLTIYAYNPDPDIVDGILVATIPNYYANVYAKVKGKPIMRKELADRFIQDYVDAVLNNEQPAIIALNDLAEALVQKYPELRQPGFGQIPPGEFDLADPSGLRNYVEYRHLGEYSKKTPQKWADIGEVLTDYKGGDVKIDKPKEFITTDANQKAFEESWARMLDIIRNGRFQQLKLEWIDLLFPEDLTKTKVKKVKKLKTTSKTQITPTQLELDIDKPTQLDVFNDR